MSFIALIMSEHLCQSNSLVPYIAMLYSLPKATIDMYFFVFIKLPFLEISYMQSFLSLTHSFNVMLFYVCVIGCTSILLFFFKLMAYTG